MFFVHWCTPFRKISELTRIPVKVMDDLAQFMENNHEIYVQKSGEIGHFLICDGFCDVTLGQSVIHQAFLFLVELSCNDTINVMTEHFFFLIDTTF